MTRKTRSGTVDSQIRAMVNAAAPEIEPPPHVRLRDKDRPFWSGIMASRARDEWSKNDLIVAAQLARCQADIETESEIVEIEGSVVENARGTQIMNPRHSVLEQMARRELALMRALAMTASNGGKDKGNTEAARKLQRESSGVRDELADDSLLAL